MAQFSSIQRSLFLILIGRQVFTLPINENKGSFYEKLKSNNEEMENDVILRRKVRQIYVDPKYKWPKGSVPYRMEGDVFSENMTNLIQEAMREFHEHTCIRFVPHTTEKDFVDVLKEKEICGAHVGKLGGKQLLVLNEGYCFNKGVILHELMHAIGFIHEHLRPDRDEFITIFEENIEPGMEKYFEKLNMSEIATSFKYSYETIMHYPGNMLSKDPEELLTMEAKKPGVILPSAFKMAALPSVDIQRINLYYRCPARGEGNEDVLL